MSFIIFYLTRVKQIYNALDQGVGCCVRLREFTTKMNDLLIITIQFTQFFTRLKQITYV